MSQYPSPYPQSPYAPAAADASYYQPPADLLGPARRAGVLMIVMGVLVAILGLCNGGGAYFTPAEEMASQQAAIRPAGVPESPLSPQAMRTAAIAFGALTLAAGLAFVIDGAYVVRGSPVAITVGIVLAGGLAALLGLFVVVCLVSAVAAPLFLMFACLFAVPTGMLGWLLWWLIGAARNNAAVAMARQQYQSQFYQYHQQQNAYAQQGGSYGAPYAPAPPGYGYGYPAPQQSQPQQQPPAPPAPGVPPGERPPDAQ